MSTTQSINVDKQNSISIIDNQQIKQNHIDKIKTIHWTQRIKNFFIINNNRIALINLLFTLLCVIIQHIMGTCEHSISNGNTILKWYIFTPPFGAGPHTSVYFFVLSWITLIYSIQYIWFYLITNICTSKKRNLIIHGIIVILYFIAFSFNIWGYILCESSSQINLSKKFIPGKFFSIPLIAGILTSFATACSFFSEHIIVLMKLLKNRQESNDSISNRILL
ncbi:unnamed protein product [Rotaria sp. Silwood1]|nr:unnamed protein product [Rotaria sp. Silwood1]CAF1600785.1 unnamed protein product [Rotaria sp. Silwood1]